MKRINKRLMSLLLVLAMLITSLLPGTGIIAAEDTGSSSAYAISIDPVDHGKVETDKQEYHHGETVTVSVEPDQGYRLQELQAESQDGTGIKLQEQDGTFQFSMPAGNVKIIAVMEENRKETGEPDTEQETTGDSETQQPETPQSESDKESEDSKTPEKEQKKENAPKAKQGSGETESSHKEETTNKTGLWNAPEQKASLQSVQEKMSRAAADDVDYVAIKNSAKGLFQGATKITDGLAMPNDYTGFMRRTSGLAPTLHFSYDSTYETSDKSYPSIILKAAYKDGRISATYPRSCYYNGTWVDIKVTATDWKKDGDNNINMFFTGERPGVMVQNCSWIELKYDFYIAGTATPIVVKGYSTWKDIDFDQGSDLKDGFVWTKASI